MVDTLFWPFAIKAVAEHMNTFHVNSAGQTPESLMYGVVLETVPVRNAHSGRGTTGSRKRRGG